jgi:hypothetical protein
MGYTHYWEHHEIAPDLWARISADAKRLADAHQVSPEQQDAGDLAFLADDDLIRFDVYEDFWLERNPGRGRGMAFCKTGGVVTLVQPADRLVCAVLALAEEIAPEAIKVSSDGDADNWRPALEWAATVLGRPVPLPRALRETQPA